ncbi:phage tail protein [Sphingomonas sp. PAMC 26605]|uniref:phage tail protein n=1 Tax=Sphingomonas sp. PAMC 26605 TaxID=1112214 RepID=UPI00026CCA42|nr:phage tail protein [Sphingomonas sp. PAMC 26605]
MATRLDPYAAFRFRVEIDAIEQGGFQSVAGLARETKIEPYREGGVNQFEQQHASQTTYPALTLKRGLVDTRLWDWHQDVIRGTIVRKTISIVLLDSAGAETWRWVCDAAFPSKWTGADLDAQRGEVATEAVELVHHGLTKQ